MHSPRGCSSEPPGRLCLSAPLRSSSIAQRGGDEREAGIELRGRGPSPGRRVRAAQFLCAIGKEARVSERQGKTAALELGERDDELHLDLAFSLREMSNVGHKRDII